MDIIILFKQLGRWLPVHGLVHLDVYLLDLLLVPSLLEVSVVCKIRVLLSLGSSDFVFALHLPQFIHKVILKFGRCSLDIGLVRVAVSWRSLVLRRTGRSGGVLLAGICEICLRIPRLHGALDIGSCSLELFSLLLLPSLLNLLIDMAESLLSSRISSSLNWTLVSDVVVLILFRRHLHEVLHILIGSSA